MMSSGKHIQDIMLRHLNGESTVEEADTLLQWIRESPANEEEFMLVKRLWSDSADAALHMMDIDNAWQHVRSQTVEKQSGIIALVPWKKLAGVAASVLLLAGAYYFYNRSSSISWKETLAQNSTKIIQMPDGSVITVRKGGKILIPENFGKQSREVKLEGEAYFEIQHDEKNPFYVLTPKSVIQDIGTAFLVESNDSAEQVTVIEGEVSFAIKDKKENQLNLKAGESAILKKEEFQRKSIETKNLLSWKTKTLVFNNTPLSQVVKDIENYYSIKVQLPKDLSQVQITAQFKNEPLDQMLKELQLFTGMEFRLEGSSLIISGN